MNKNKPIKAHGGKRKGSGRPRRDTAVRVFVMIEQTSVDYFKKLGKGKGRQGKDSIAYGMDEAVKVLKASEKAAS